MMISNLVENSGKGARLPSDELNPEVVSVSC